MDTNLMDAALEAVESETICSICYAEFLDPDDLKVHVDQVHLTEVSKQRYCQFCSSIFNSLENYVYHIRDVHLTSLKCCRYCFRAFTDGISLRKHESKHYTYVRKSYYSCSQCKEQFLNVYELEVHERKSHPDVTDGVMLHECYSLLTSILNMKAIVVLQNSRETTTFNCHRCNYSNTDLSTYIAHLKKENCKTLVCDACSNMYKNKKGLFYHIKRNRMCRDYVTDKYNKEKCSSCLKDVEFTLLKIHKEYCKPVKCTICQAMFDTVEEYTKHQSTEHPLAVCLTVCDFCHKEFVGNVSLQKHILRVHSPDFPFYKYTCVYCDKPHLFKHPKDLFTHFFTKHSSLHPYSCKICNKTFKLRKKFTIHIKLDHKSIGFVEFDENYNVFFTDKKSEHPFQPQCLIDESLLQQTSASNETILSKSDTVENFETTDQETDVEKTDKAPEKRHPKLRVKDQIKSNVNLVNIESDFMQSATEAEGNQTEAEGNKFEPEKIETDANLTESEALLVPTNKTRKRKVKSKAQTWKKSKKDDSYMEIEFLDSDDEPLVEMKRKINKRPWRPNYEHRNSRLGQLRKDNKKRFTCNVCKKYCYTFQNYNHHLSTHFKNKTKTCIKCSKNFDSNTELERHIKKEHGSSRLTETLRSLLDKRRRGCADVTQMTRSELFQRTIKKYKSDYSAIKFRSSAKIEERNELSVKNFIESFTPDEVKKQPIQIENAVTVKPLKTSMKKLPAIKMTKFVRKPEPTKIGKLKMPVRYKQHSYFETPKVYIKMVSFTNNAYEEDYDSPIYQESFVDYNDTSENVEQRQMNVPEVAQEVMLEGSEEQKPPSNIIPHKLILPKLPMQSNQAIRIAHLLPEAPFYKIVKVQDLMDTNKKAKPQSSTDDKAPIILPGGTKLVNVNPLAHLLGKTAVETLPGLSNKYYKPKNKNFESAIAKAMLKLETPRKNYKKKKSIAPEETSAMEVEQ